MNDVEEPNSSKSEHIYGWYQISKIEDTYPHVKCACKKCTMIPI